MRFYYVYLHMFERQKKIQSKNGFFSYRFRVNTLIFSIDSIEKQSLVIKTKKKHKFTHIEIRIKFQNKKNSCYIL